MGPGAPPADPEAAARPYLVTIVALGSLALVGGLVAAALDIGPWLDWRSLALFGTLALGSHVVLQSLVLFEWRGHRVALAPDEMLVLIALVALPMPMALLFAAPPMALHGWRTKRPFLKGAFNVSSMLLATSVGIGAFLALRAAGTSTLVSALVALAPYTVTTHWIVSGVYARRSGVTTWRVFSERFIVPSGLHVLLGAAVGITILALWSFHPLAVAAVLPFAYFAREHVALLARSDREVEARRRLADVAHDLAGEATEDVVAARVVACCAALFNAGRVTMTIHEDDGHDRVWTDDFEDGPDTLRAPLVAPIVARGGRGLGAIRVHALTRTREGFGAHDMRLLEVVAAEAAAGILNARALAAAAAPQAAVSASVASAGGMRPPRPPS